MVTTLPVRVDHERDVLNAFFKSNLSDTRQSSSLKVAEYSHALLVPNRLSVSVV